MIGPASEQPEAITCTWPKDDRTIQEIRATARATAEYDALIIERATERVKQPRAITAYTASEGVRAIMFDPSAM